MKINVLSNRFCSFCLIKKKIVPKYKCIISLSAIVNMDFVAYSVRDDSMYLWMTLRKHDIYITYVHQASHTKSRYHQSGSVFQPLKGIYRKNWLQAEMAVFGAGCSGLRTAYTIKSQLHLEQVFLVLKLKKIKNAF